MDPTHRKTLRELIAFYLDAGVDALLGEEPVDRFADEPGADRRRRTRGRTATLFGPGAIPRTPAPIRSRNACPST